MRDLCRARGDMVEDLDRARRLGAFLLRHGRIWRGGSRWSLKHEQWLNTVRFDDPALTSTFDHYRAVVDTRGGEWMLLRADSASATHAFVDGLRQRGIEFSIGFPLTEDVRHAGLSLPSQSGHGRARWTRPAGSGRQRSAQGRPTCWISARGPRARGPSAAGRTPTPGQLTFTDQDGHRFQVFITDSPDPDLAHLEARHRGHARVEDRRCAKDTGMANLPFHDFAANQAWLTLVLMAQDLLAWAQRLCLDGQLAKAEPKRLRYALWHVAGRLVTTGRRRILRLAKGWPWADERSGPSARLQALAVPT